DSLLDPAEARLLVQQHIAVEVHEEVRPTLLDRGDAAENRIPAIAVGLAHWTRKVLPVDLAPVLGRIVDRDDGVHDTGLKQLRATRLQLFRGPDPRLPPEPPSKRGGIDHQEAAREAEPAGSDQMRDRLKHEPGIGAGDQDRQVTGHGVSAMRTFGHGPRSPDDRSDGRWYRRSMSASADAAPAKVLGGARELEREEPALRP